MGQQKGQNYALSIGDAGSPEIFTILACLTDKEITINNKVIDGTSDCGPIYNVGFANNSCTCKGFVDYANPVTESGVDLLDLANSKASADWKIDAISPVTGDQIITFVGFIASYKQTWQTDQMIGFDCTIQVSGNFTQTLVP